MKSVTQIISEIYPFQGDGFQKKLAYESLSTMELEVNSIAHRAGHLDQQQVLKVLNLYGSIAHRMAKLISNKEQYPISDPILSDIGKGLEKFFIDYRVTPLFNELSFELPNEYTGTIDLVCELTWKSCRKICVLDFKTYGLYKLLYGLPYPEQDRKKTIPYKLKSVGLQTSMYANAFKTLYPQIVNERGYILMLVWMTPFGVFPYELEDSLSPYIQYKRNQW